MGTPELHRLVAQGDADGIARLLSTHRADVDAYDASGRTALMCAAQDPDTDTRILELLIQHGATLQLQARGDFDAGRTAIGFAVAGGDPRKVATLVAAGASIHFQDKHGHDALLNAVHHRDITRDPRLMSLLELLITYGVRFNTETSHRETGLRTLSRLGRFDAIKLLLAAGADAAPLQWNAMHRAVAVGELDELKRLLDDGHSTEDLDWWQRTPWLIAVLAGDREKAQLLQEYGANVHARGRCGVTPLQLAIMGNNARMLEWLIASGQEVDQTDDFGGTALIEASEYDDVELARILLNAGSNVDHRDHIPHTALAKARSRPMTQLLLAAGADIRELHREGQRALLGLPADTDRSLVESVAVSDFARGRDRRFGTRNPELMNEPFWQAMIRAGVGAYAALDIFGEQSPNQRRPVWCAERYGQSITFLNDGRIVQIGGEHEDSYDPDFCIYNDVFVHHADGRIDIYGYPEATFAPTDFHTATLIGRHIFVIGSLGYAGTRVYGHTPVYRLDIATFSMERIDCSGGAPGWIHRHLARALSPTEIEITSGKIITSVGGTEEANVNDRTFVLDIERRVWRELV